jgi:hypothetical protein
VRDLSINANNATASSFLTSCANYFFCIVSSPEEMSAEEDCSANQKPEGLQLFFIMDPTFGLSHLLPAPSEMGSLYWIYQLSTKYFPS